MDSRKNGSGGDPAAEVAAVELEDRDWELDDHDWSHKAWMSVTDADLFEAILLRRASERPRLDVLEWGSGRSTVYYSRLLARRGIRFRWLSLEYDRAFFRDGIEPELEALPHPYVVYVNDEHASEIRLGGEPAHARQLEFVVFDKGRLQPQLRAHREDRNVDMDPYVEFPARQERAYDVVLVDGRKRRRCLREAAGMLADGGVAVLHDAWRPYYHCAFEYFESGQRVGDILWVGMQEGESELRGLLEAVEA